MNRALNSLNLLGVLALAALCVFQWRANSALVRDLRRNEGVRLAQSVKIDEQAANLRGLSDDLDRFRAQLSDTTLALKTSDAKLDASEKLVAQLETQRDQLKAAVEQWTAAVALRDQRLADANQRIQDLNTRLADAVAKFNALAKTHNDLVRRINEAGGLPAPAKVDASKDDSSTR